MQFAWLLPAAPLLSIGLRGVKRTNMHAGQIMSDSERWPCQTEPGKRELRMLNVVKAGLAILLMMVVAGCTTTERAAAVGAGTGAVIGAVATGNVQGAAIGGAIGAVSGALIGRAMSPGNCYYRDRNGRRYDAPCR
jgi:hypothetical protein